MRLYHALARFACKYKASRVFLVHAYAKVMALDAGLVRCNARVHLQHVGAQGVLAALVQVVGVVLHEGAAPMPSLP